MESNKDITRESIIAAAGTAFSKLGYKKTTMDDIACFTNVSKTGIYYYFKNKEEVFNEVIKKEAEKLQTQIYEAVNQESSPIDKLFAYVNVRMSVLNSIFNYYSTFRHNLLEHFDIINHNRKEFDKVETDILMKILEEGINKGDFFIEQVEETAKTIMLTLRSLEIPFFGIENQGDYKIYLERLITICLYGIIPR